MLAGGELALALAIVALGAAALGSVGFGLGLVTSPVLLQLLAVKDTVVIINFLIAAVLLLALLQTWRHLRPRASAGLIIGGVAAAPLGALALEWADLSALKILIGAVIVLLGLASLREVRLPLASHAATGPVFGFVTSFLVTASGIGGPLAGVYALAQRWPPPEIRATLSVFFLTSSLTAIGLYGGAGLITRTTLANVGLLLPAVAVGFGLAALLVSRLNQRAFRYAMTAMVLLGGGTLLARELAGWW